MFFRTFIWGDVDDSSAGTGGPLDSFGGPILSLLILGMVAIPCVMTAIYRTYLVFPFAMLMIGAMIGFSAFHYQNENSFLRACKLALALCLVTYAIPSFPYILAPLVGSGSTKGMMLLAAVIIGTIPLILMAWNTVGVTALLAVLWVAGYLAGISRGGYPKITGMIMNTQLLFAPIIIILGTFNAIKSKDKRRVQFIPKMVALALGCLPLLLARFMPMGLNATWHGAAIVIGCYVICYLIFALIARNGTEYSDYLLYPFILTLGCYYFVNGFNDFRFPSPVINKTYEFLAKYNVIWENTFRICRRFSSMLSEMIFKFMSLLKSGAYAKHFEIPGLIGALVVFAFICVLCSLIGRIIFHARTSGE